MSRPSSRVGSEDAAGGRDGAIGAGADGDADVGPGEGGASLALIIH
jgi:hypothetical protein